METTEGKKIEYKTVVGSSDINMDCAVKECYDRFGQHDGAELISTQMQVIEHEHKDNTYGKHNYSYLRLLYFFSITFKVEK